MIEVCLDKDSSGNENSISVLTKKMFAKPRLYVEGGKYVRSILYMIQKVYVVRHYFMRLAHKNAYKPG